MSKRQSSFEGELATHVGLSDYLVGHILDAYESGDSDSFWNVAEVYEETQSRIEEIELAHALLIAAFAWDRVAIEAILADQQAAQAEGRDIFRINKQPLVERSVGSTALASMVLSGKLGIDF